MKKIVLCILVLVFLEVYSQSENNNLVFKGNLLKGYSYEWNGIPVEIINESEKKLATTKDRFKKMIATIGKKNFKEVTKINIVDEKVFNMVIFYDNFSIDNEDIKNLLIQGIVFQLDNRNDTVIYNFSILHNNYLIRINGVYLGIDRIKDKIGLAMKNPASYIEEHDPEYFLSQLSENSIMIEELKKEIVNSSKKLEDFMKVWLAYQNSSFFGTPRPVNKEILKEIIELKRNNDKITAKEVGVTLEDKNISVNKDVIEFIFSLYFLEFPK